MAKPLKKSLKKTAEENTIVKRKSGRDEPETVKEGIPNEHSRKHDLNNQPEVPRVGVSIGCTLNMENYESARIDCWLSDNVQEGETIEEAYTRVISIVESHVNEVAETYR